MSLHKVLTNIIPEKILAKKNEKKQWEYGWDPEYDMVVISRDGTIGDIYEIANLRVAIRLINGSLLIYPKNYLALRQSLIGIGVTILLRING